MIKKVLIIDDDQMFSALIKQSLVGLEVKIAPNIEVGLDLVDEFKPDLIVLDIIMPGSNGLNLLHELISYDDTVKIPIIICSSVANNLNAEEFKNINVIKILDKTTMRPDDIYYEIKRLNNG